MTEPFATGWGAQINGPSNHKVADGTTVVFRAWL